VLALLYPSRGRTTVGVLRISIHTLMHILEPDSEADCWSDNGLHLYCLTGLHATNRVIMCSIIYNMNLAYGEGIRLDCCNVICTTGELDMTISMLGRIYFMLSCQLTPTDAASVQHGRRAVVRSQMI
jgi:hypothetical protein